MEQLPGDLKSDESFAGAGGERKQDTVATGGDAGDAEEVVETTDDCPSHQLERSLR